MKKIIELLVVIVFLCFIIISFSFNIQSGKEIAFNFFDFLIDMLKIVPLTFILIGLFDVWIKKETIEKHLGDNSGIKGYFWIILLAGTTVGGLFVALPVSGALKQKGAKLSIIFTYLGTAAICRVPMTAFEINFLGLKFTLIRLIVSIPLIIISSILLAKITDNNTLLKETNLNK